MKYEQSARTFRNTAKNYAMRSYRLPYEEGVRIGEEDEPKEDAYPINSEVKRTISMVVRGYSMKGESG